jgi:filamentous hemagglutinin
MKKQKSHTMKHYRLSLGRRITAAFMAAFMLLQICLPTIAFAATVLSNDKITGQLLSNAEYQGSASPNYLFEKAAYLNQTVTIQNETLETFFKTLVAAKIALPKPKFIPIAGDITIFIPTYPLGKLVGDAYVQTRFVRTQIMELLGRHLIDVGLYPTEIEQINKLYKQAKDFAISHPQYIFGTNLPASEIISADMIWPELRNINGQNVLVPIVYLTANTIATRGVKGHTIEFNGPLTELAGITLDNTVLNARRDSYLRVMRTLINNGGAINLGDNATLNSNTIINNGGSINGAGNLTIVANGTLQNLSGTITAKQNLDITAAQFTNKTVVYPYTDKYGTGGYLGPISVVSAGTRDASGQVSTVGNLSIKSTKGDINFIGSDANATGTMTLDSQGNINILGVTIEKNSNGYNGQWQVATNSIDVFKSRLTAQENLKLISSGAINIQASDLVSTKGGIELLAGMGIYIVDDQNQTSVRKVDKIGKKTGTESDFQTFAIRSVLSAGKKILLYTENGDITLKAAKITSTEGTQVTAKNGKVHLLITKEQNQHYLNTVRKGFWTIKTVNDTHVEEKGTPNAIVGGFAVEALEGVDVEYAGIDMNANPKLTLADQIEEYRKMPDMKWMADLYDNQIQKIDWTQVELVYKDIREHKTNLSPAAMAIIAIAVCVATAGTGAALVGATQGSLYATVANAAVTSLATQAAQSLAAGNSLNQTLHTMGSNESLKSLATTMATAGMMPSANLEMFKVAEGASTAISLLQQAGQAIVNATIQAGVSVTISGGNSDAYKKAFTQSLAANAINSLGTKIAGKISNAKIDVATQYIAHAAMGCLAASLTSKLNDTDVEPACLSGAGGAIISQAMTAKADKLDSEIKDWAKKNTTNPENITYKLYQEKLEYFRTQGVNLAKLTAALAAFAVGGDISAAADSADTVARSNMYKAVDLASIYLDVNGNTNCGSLSFSQCQLAHVREVVAENFEQAGFTKTETDNLQQLMEDKGLLNAAAEINALYYGDGKNIDALLKQKNGLGGSTTTGADGIEELVVVGRDDFAQQLGRFAAGTKQIVDSLTPGQQKAFGIVIGGIVTGPVSAIVSAVQNSAIEYVIPESIANAIGVVTEGITNGIGTGITAFIEHDDKVNLLDEYNTVANLATTTDEYRDTVGGFGWIVTSVTGLGGKKGTNKSPSATYIKNPGDGSLPPSGKKFAFKKAPLGKNFKNGHLSKVDIENGKYKISGGGLSGGHNKEEFLKAMQNPRSIDSAIQDSRYRPGHEKGKIIAEREIKDINGRVVGKEFDYTLPLIDTRGVIQYDDLGNVKYIKNGKPVTKTCYDPKVVNDADYAVSAERVSQKAYDQHLQEYLSNPRDRNKFELIDQQSGMKFMVYFNQDLGVNSGQPFIGNAHVVSQ